MNMRLTACALTLMVVFTAVNAHAEGYGRTVSVSASVLDGGYIGFYANDAVKEGNITTHSVSNLPSSYDSRDYGYITSVKSQGTEGCCWAFAEIGAIEANLIKKGLVKNEDADYSEAHAVWFGINSYDNRYKDGIKLDNPYQAYEIGGNDRLMVAALSKRAGLVPEKNAPYENKEEGQREIQRFSSDIRLKNALIYSLDDIDGIKSAIMEYGAVTYGMYSDWNSYLNNNEAFYCPVNAYGNHEVLIVGWDDNYSAANFKNSPKKNGAWIARNSYGNKFGRDGSGYFMISYENKAELCHAVAYDMDLAVKDYDNIYLYDGAQTEYIFEWFLDEECKIKDMETRLAGANIFTAENDEILKAVSYYTDDPTGYEVHVYRGSLFDEAEEIKEACTKGSIEHPGYYTIPLNQFVSLEKGETFTVAIVNDGGVGISFERADIGGSQDKWMEYGTKYEYYEQGQSVIGDWNGRTIETMYELGNVSIRALTDDAGDDQTKNQRSKLDAFINVAKKIGNVELIKKANEIESLDLEKKSEINNADIELLNEYAKYTQKDYIVISKNNGEEIEADTVLLDGESEASIIVSFYDETGRFVGMNKKKYLSLKSEYRFNDIPENAVSYKVMVLKNGIIPAAYYSEEVINK